MDRERLRSYAKVILKTALICSVILILVFFISNVINRTNEVVGENVEADFETILLKDTPISVEIMDDPEGRSLGLSGRESLDIGSGLLFVFDESGRHGFWMKDMNFSIDIIWFNDAGEVVHIEENVSPDSYPKIFYPSENSRLVLEVNTGFVEKNDIFIGDTIDLY